MENFVLLKSCLGIYIYIFFVISYWTTKCLLPVKGRFFLDPLTGSSEPWLCPDELSLSLEKNIKS